MRVFITRGPVVVGAMLSACFSYSVLRTNRAPLSRAETLKFILAIEVLYWESFPIFYLYKHDFELFAQVIEKIRGTPYYFTLEDTNIENGPLFRLLYLAQKLGLHPTKVG